MRDMLTSDWIGIGNVIILFITSCFLVKYTKATEVMKDQAIKQTELEQIPVMLMNIRDKKDYMSDLYDGKEQQKVLKKFGDYLIRIRTETENSDYFIRLRNMGRGIAFNVRVENEIFKVVRYESQFFAPLKDEYSIKIVEKGEEENEEGKKIESWEKLNGSIFVIYCEDATGKEYHFRYRILDIKNKQIKFLGKR